MKLEDAIKLSCGGAGSGDYGHSGRPGQKGGSQGKGGARPTRVSVLERQQRTYPERDSELGLKPIPGFPKNAGPGPGHPELKINVNRTKMAERIVSLMNRWHIGYHAAIGMGEDQWAKIGQAVRLEQGFNEEQAQKYNPSTMTRKYVLGLLQKRYKIRRK